MIWFLYGASMLFIVIGAIVVLYTDWARAWMKRALGQRHTHLLGLIPLIFGVLMIVSAAWSEVFWLILILGLIASAKGLYLVFARKEQVEMIIKRWLGKASDQFLRFCGLILVVLGTTLLSWI